MKKHIFSILIIFLAVAITLIAIILLRSKFQAPIVGIPSYTHQATKLAETQTQPENKNPNSSILNLKSINLLVPFTPQAPTANWDQLHNEACEEASAIMANAYFTGSTEVNLKPAYVETEIAKLTKWEQDNFGYHLDTTVGETAQMIEQVYGLNTKLISNYTENDIKAELNSGRVVLLSEYGRALGNPNYKSPGPIHHMLVIKGYNQNMLLTNDSGTRRGLNYPYSFNVLYSAAADWDHVINNVDTNIKIAIVVWK